jgi:5-methylcytosine-specific restriction endonuclease McrA
VWNAVDQRFRTDKTKSERHEIAVSVARILQMISKLWQDIRRRRALSRDDKRLLLDISGKPPRCWICGAAFKEVDVDNFLFGRTALSDLPRFVDVLRPRGLDERDLSIEVDHVVPFSRGGQDKGNLALSCGWCNRAKGAYTSIYDVAGQPLRAQPNSIGLHSLPQPFWVVRLLALGEGCTHPDGCELSRHNAELTIAPIREAGALNITNLRVTCFGHDSLGSRRLQPPGFVRKLWGR